MELRTNKETNKVYVKVQEPPKRLLNFYANLKRTDKSDPNYLAERLPDEALQASLRRYIREQPEYKSLLAGKLPSISLKGLPVKSWQEPENGPKKPSGPRSVNRQFQSRRPQQAGSAPINVSVVNNKAFHKIKSPQASDSDISSKDVSEAPSSQPFRPKTAPPEMSFVEMASQPRTQSSFANTGIGLGRVCLQMDDVIAGNDSKILSMTYSSSVLNTNPKVLTDDIVRLSLKREVARDFIVGRIENRLAGIRKKRKAYEEMLQKKAKMRAQAEQVGRREEGRERSMYQSLLEQDKKHNKQLFTISERENVRQEKIKSRTSTIRRPMLPVFVRVRQT